MNPSCPSRYSLEAFFADEPVSSAFARHFSECAECIRELARLKDFQRGYLLEHPRAPHVPGKAWWRSWRSLGPAALVPLAACLLFALRTRPPEIRIKGDRLQVVYRRGDVTQRVTPRTVLHPGDALRLLYSTSQAGYLMVVDRDGSGVTRVLHPYGKHAAAAIEPGINVVLPGSLALDDAPGPEHLVALFRRTPFDDGVAQGLSWHPWESRPASCSDCEMEFLELSKEP